MAGNFELFFGCFGNGITVYNKTAREQGDYKKIAHISEHGVIKFYVSENYVPEYAMLKIKNECSKNKESFLKVWNKKNTLDKYAYLMDISGIGFGGLTKFHMMDIENIKIPLEKRVAMMEKIFFETHM